MYKFGRCVYTAAVHAGLLVLSSLVLSGAPSMTLQSQEVPHETEEQRQAREALNQGVQSFRNGQYEEATAAFQRAKLLDPRLLNARLYLATTYASQYIPGAPSESNQEFGRKSVEEFRGVLEIDAQNMSAIDGIGSIVFQMAGTPFDAEKFKESKSYHQKHIELRPNDPEPYYWVGVIDWTLSFRANHELRGRYNERTSSRKQVRETDPLPTEVRQEYLRDFGPAIDEGIDSLKRAIELRPDYDDAMAYLNLLYRRKADTVSFEDERARLLKMADDLIDRVKMIKEKRAEAPQ